MEKEGENLVLKCVKSPVALAQIVFPFLYVELVLTFK